MAYELNGQSFDVDEEGYITDISLWSKDLADLIAQGEEIDDDPCI